MDQNNTDTYDKNDNNGSNEHGNKEEFEICDELILNNNEDELISFPHYDRSRIDVRTIEPGDGRTYADPFSVAEVKYTGYQMQNKKWIKYTSENVSSTIFETRLGNHENIIGLEQAILSMSKGEIIQVWIPQRLGYGIHGAEPLIPPKTDLLFILTLVNVYDQNGEIIDGKVLVDPRINKKKIPFCSKFDNEWNQISFDNIYNTMIQIDSVQNYPVEILICISNFAMDRLFPHNNNAKIDIKTIQSGDSETYADPYAAVDLKYIGYKMENKKWMKFTAENIASTVFETRLGNHENVIGLEQAILSMSLGEMARVWIPWRLAYGKKGAEPLIPPHTDLVMELTLVDITNDFISSDEESNGSNIDLTAN